MKTIIYKKLKEKLIDKVYMIVFIISTIGLVGGIILGIYDIPEHE